MTKLSQFKQAAAQVEELRKLRRLRQAYGNGDSPPRCLVLELATDCKPEPVILLASTRAKMNRVLEHEEMTITAELRALGVQIDIDGPL
jgi:hypothetical protein